MDFTHTLSFKYIVYVQANIPFNNDNDTVVLETSLHMT